MNSRFRILGLATSFAIAASGMSSRLFDDTATLKYVPKVGDTAKYRVKVVIDIPGSTAEVSLLDSHKILSVDPSGDYVEESKNTEGKIVFSGKDNPIPEETTKTTYHPDGNVAKIEGTDVTADSYRTENLQQFFPPAAAVKVGDSWTVQVKADPKLGTVAMKVDYKVESAERIGDHSTFKIKATSKEEGSTPGMSDGYVWIDTKDGTLVKVEAKVTNLPVPNSSSPVNGTVSVIREG